MASGDTFPTINVLAASPLYPFFNATKSTLTISPSFIIVFFDGIPCITTSFTEIHVDAGYGGIPLIPGSYPFSADIAPFFFIVSSAILSISAVVIPGFIASSIALCVKAVTLPASLINSISFFDFIVTIFILPFKIYNL